MSASVSAKVVGLAELQRTMRKAGADIADLSEVNAQAVALMGAGARSRAPRRTGRLVASITTGSTATGTSLGAGAVYAGVLEYGDPRRHREPQPYLRPGVLDTQPQWLPLYEAKINEALGHVKGA